jgi:hypothetical protein
MYNDEIEVKNKKQKRKKCNSLQLIMVSRIFGEFSKIFIIFSFVKVAGLVQMGKFGDNLPKIKTLASKLRIGYWGRI